MAVRYDFLVCAMYHRGAHQQFSYIEVSEVYLNCGGRTDFRCVIGVLHRFLCRHIVYCMYQAAFLGLRFYHSSDEAVIGPTGNYTSLHDS